MDPEHPDAVTIGIAIEIPEPFRTQLRDMRASLGDPQAHVVPPHITLLPPSKVSPQRWAAVADHLSAVAARHRRFAIELNGMETFRPVSPVVFARLARGADECRAIEADVRTGPLAKDVEFEYHPHVTVAHHLDDETLDRAERQLGHYQASFTVRGFEWYRWDDDAGWTTHEVFHLAT